MKVELFYDEETPAGINQYHSEDYTVLQVPRKPYKVLIDGQDVSDHMLDDMNINVTFTPLELPNGQIDETKTKVAAILTCALTLDEIVVYKDEVPTQHHVMGVFDNAEQ